MRRLLPRVKLPRPQPGVALRRLLHWYGAGPLHLLTMIGCFALAGYAAVKLLPNNWFGIPLWFAGAVIGHDLLLMPLYTLADRSVTAVFRHRPARLPAGSVNYVRVPAMLSGLLLLIWFPLILRLPGGFERTTTLSLDPYLWHWLAVTGALFLLSAAALALRLRLSPAGAPDPETPPADDLKESPKLTVPGYSPRPPLSQRLAGQAASRPSSQPDSGRAAGQPWPRVPQGRNVLARSATGPERSCSWVPRGQNVLAPGATGTIELAPSATRPECSGPECHRDGTLVFLSATRPERLRPQGPMPVGPGPPGVSSPRCARLRSAPTGPPGPRGRGRASRRWRSALRRARPCGAVG
jgi:hypothetical protein